MKKLILLPITLLVLTSCAKTQKPQGNEDPLNLFNNKPAVTVDRGTERDPLDLFSVEKEKNTVYDLSSKEYAIMGKQVFSAFQCSSWAEINGNYQEAERLFTYGYERGETFIGALRADKIESGDLSSQVPIGVTIVLQGPSDEFILGRIYSNAAEDALDQVYKTGDVLSDDQMQKIIATNKYMQSNCDLIGK